MNYTYYTELHNTTVNSELLVVRPISGFYFFTSERILVITKTLTLHMGIQTERQTRKPSRDRPQIPAARYCPKNINYLTMQPTTYCIVSIRSDLYDSTYKLFIF
jgi:hypothetical protein